MHSNLYLNEVDKMLEKAKEATRGGQYTYIEYARYADDLVVLIDAYKCHDWALTAVMKRLKEEFAKLTVEINEEKSRIVGSRSGRKLRCLQSQPLNRVVELINPVLRSWVGYFAIGHSSRCFGLIKDWLEKKVYGDIWGEPVNNRALAGTGRVGSGCTRPWGRSMVTGSSPTQAESAASTIGHINWDL